METLPFTNPSTSSKSSRVGPVIVAGARTFPLLPYDDAYLNGETNDKRVECVTGNFIGVASTAGL